MGAILGSARAGKSRRRLAILGSFAMLLFYAQLSLAGPAAATNYSGGLSPTVIDGLADLNGDNDVTGRDDANAFYGDTHIIDGMLDCDAWAATNDGAAGDGTITIDDDCTLVGYDGTVAGVTIDVVDGVFQAPDGSLPTVFNATDPDNADVGDSDFAWSAINGRVDANGSETINANDCHFGLIGATADVGLGDPTDGPDVLGNTQANTNPCGFGTPPAAADNGLVDLNSDGDITAGADSCTDGCLMGHNVTSGLVQLEGAAAPGGVLSGGFSPTIVGGRADLNGDGVANGRDDANAFYGDTHIIDGWLDCDAWTTDNDGTSGNGAIGAADDCTMVGYDGTADGVTIDVVDGEFQAANGPLPVVFNAADPDNADIGDSDFAWSAIGGRVDSSGNELITADDCHFGLVGKTVDAGLGDPTDGADILGNNQADTNPCGFAVGPDPADNGLVDLDSDGEITAADDSCDDCFFGHDVDTGFVMAFGPETLVLSPSTSTTAIGDDLTVTAHVEDGDGAPVEGVTVAFDVTGANVGSGTQTTDAEGDATFTYAGSAVGDDTIDAFADTDGDDGHDAGEPGDTATAAWEEPPAECPGYEGDPRNDVVGTSGPDDLTGTSGKDIICGLDGKDSISASGQADLVIGGAGSDEILGGKGPDSLYGGRGSDLLKGGKGNDDLFGGKGNDNLSGGQGEDFLNGGPGTDSCVGGDGRDTYKSCEDRR